jgi:hypothetical protein
MQSQRYSERPARRLLTPPDIARKVDPLTATEKGA